MAGEVTLKPGGRTLNSHNSRRIAFTAGIAMQWIECFGRLERLDSKIKMAPAGSPVAARIKRK